MLVFISIPFLLIDLQLAARRLVSTPFTCYYFRVTKVSRVKCTSIYYYFIEQRIFSAELSVYPSPLPSPNILDGAYQSIGSNIVITFSPREYLSAKVSIYNL